MEPGDLASYYPTEGECGPSPAPRAARVIEVKGQLALIEISLGPVSGRGPFRRRAHTPISSTPGTGMLVPGTAYEKHFGYLVDGAFEDDRPELAPSLGEVERRLAVLAADREALLAELAEIKRRLDDAERRAAKAKGAPTPAAAAAPTEGTAPQGGK